MLKQNLTKVIAVATIAASALFIAGCGEEEVAGDEKPLIGDGSPIPTPPGEGDEKPEEGKEETSEEGN
jgi:hypothetical protein